MSEGRIDPKAVTGRRSAIDFQRPKNAGPGTGSVTVDLVGFNGPLDVRNRADHGPRGDHGLDPLARRPQTVTLTGGSAAAPQESESAYGPAPSPLRPSMLPALPHSLTHLLTHSLIPSLHPSITINQSINPPGGHPGLSDRDTGSSDGGLPNAQTVPPPMTAAAGGLTSRRCQQRDP